MTPGILGYQVQCRAPEPCARKGEDGCAPCLRAGVRERAVGLRKKIKRELIGTSEYPSNQVFTISNFITAIRLVLTFVFLYLFVTDTNRYVALAIYAIAASTDWLDGQVARRTKTVSWLGKIMDPVVDRALLFTGVLGLVVRGELPIWVCAVIIGRDVYLAIGGAIVRRYHRRPIDVVYIGKAATALLLTGFSFMLLGMPVVEGLGLIAGTGTPFPGLDGTAAPFGVFLVYAGVACSLLTALTYSVKGALAIRHAEEHPDEEEEDFLNPEIVDDAEAGV